jgi:hypothetical protein
MKTNVLIFAVIAILFASCESELSSDVNQDRIFTKYILVYEAEQDVTYARAWFNFGKETGTPLELDDPSYVSFNDEDLDFQRTFAYYEDELAGFVSSGTFHWEDYDGKSYDNTIEIKEINFPDGLTEIDGSSSYELFWDGPALGNDEYVAVVINGDFEGDLSGIVEDSRGSTSIVIKKSDLDDLPKDQKATFWLEFGTNPDLSEKTGAGGKIFGKYRVMKEIMIR